MKTVLLSFTAILLCYISNAQSTKTKPTQTGTKKGTTTTGGSSKTNLPALFNKFFELSDGDSADLVLKSKIAYDICKADNTSRYCTYTAAWANIYDEKYDAALKLISDLEKSYPEWAEVYFLHSQYLNYKGEEGAIEMAQKCVEMNPKLIYPLFFLASHYQEEENYKLSLKYYNMLEQAAPEHKSVYYNRANVKSELGDEAGALADYEKCLQKNPKHFRALFNRANIYMKQEKWAKAEADMNSFIEIIPDNANAFYYRGYARYRLGKAAECCADMKKAAQLGHKSASEYASANCN